MGVKSEQIQQKLLEEDDLTIQNAIKIATAMEFSRRGGDQLYRKIIDEVSHIQHTNKVEKHIYANNRLSNFSNSRNDNGTHRMSHGLNNRATSCFRCGFLNHLANKCKYITAKCNFCKKVGHLEPVCLSKKKK
jgi:hypothetical protein